MTQDLFASLPPQLLTNTILLVALGELNELQPLLAATPSGLQGVVRSPALVPLLVTPLPPHSFVDSPGQLKDVTIFSKGGKVRLVPQQYLDLVKSAHASSFVSLSVPLPYNSSRKRMRLVIDRTGVWLNELANAEPELVKVRFSSP